MFKPQNKEISNSNHDLITLREHKRQMEAELHDLETQTKIVSNAEENYIILAVDKEEERRSGI